MRASPTCCEITSSSCAKGCANTMQTLVSLTDTSSVALYPFLNKVIVPRGATDLARDQPPADVTLIATKTSLVVREDLHPAMQYLLLNAASEIHSGPSIFNRANTFPAAEAIDMPLSSEAARFYKSGLPF